MGGQHSKTPTTTPSHSPDNRVYYCPMDEGVEQIGPGLCPICGMALVPRLTPGDDATEDNAELADMTRRFWVGVALAVPLVLWDMLGMLGAATDRWLAPGNVELARIPARDADRVLGGLALPDSRRAVGVSRHLNMFTLIAMGVIAAYGYSVVELIASLVVPHGHDALSCRRASLL